MRHAAWISEGGDVLTFDPGGPWDSPGPLYFGSLTSDLSATAETARAPRQGGTTTYYAAPDGQSVNLTGSMLVYGTPAAPAAAAYDALRARLAQAFAPHRWGTLRYYREDGAVQLRCRPLATPTISQSVGTYSTVDISFTSDSPYWESAEEMVLAIGVTTRLWRFPWAPVRGPMGTFTRRGRVDNPTGESIWPTIEIFTTAQVVTLSNLTTGQSITLEHPVAEGEKLVVDLRDVTAVLWQRDGEGVYREEEDVSHWMSLDSHPWALEPGVNYVAITNDVPEDTPAAYLRYRLPSLGV